MLAVCVHNGDVHGIAALAVLLDIGDALLGLFLGHGDVHDEIRLCGSEIVEVCALDDGHILGAVGALEQARAGGLGQHEVAAGVDDADVVHVQGIDGKMGDDVALLHLIDDQTGLIQILDLAFGDGLFGICKKFRGEIAHFIELLFYHSTTYFALRPLRISSVSAMIFSTMSLVLGRSSIRCAHSPAPAIACSTSPL